MNQRADSWKKNLQSIVAKPLINQRGWLLSHTLALPQRRKSNQTHACRESARGFRRLARDPFAFDPSKRPRHRLLQHRYVLREQKESEQQHPRANSCCRHGASDASRVGRQVAAGLTGFLGFRGLTLTGLRAAAGLMLRGLPTLTDVRSVAGSGRKNARQPGESWDLFWIMQTVMRSTSGM